MFDLADEFAGHIGIGQRLIDAAYRGQQDTRGCKARKRIIAGQLTQRPDRIPAIWSRFVQAPFPPEAV
ncbi:hypothetical protein GCM10007937_41540 [Mesorhizobium albiziae]|nr:hypothetical protein GCM10007937_41540 [Mesorhizobium albiziae]